MKLHLGVVNSLKIDQIYRRAYYGTERNSDNIYKLSDTLYKSKNLCSQLKIYLKVEFYTSIFLKNIFLIISYFLILLEKYPKYNKSS